MGRHERPPKRTIQELIDAFPRLSVRRDSTGFVHVRYAHTTDKERVVVVSPFQSPDQQRPYVSLLVSEYPTRGTSISPSEPIGRFILKPVSRITFEVDEREANGLSFEMTLRPVRQGFDLLETFVEKPPPPELNTYASHVVDELGQRDIVSDIELYGDLIDSDATTYMTYMGKILRCKPAV